MAAEEDTPADGDWADQPTQPPGTSAEQSDLKLDALPEWNDSILEAAERHPTGAVARVPQGPPSLPPAAQSEAGEEDAAEAREFFEIAARNAWGAREEVPRGSAPEIRLESDLFSLESSAFDLSAVGLEGDGSLEFELPDAARTQRGDFSILSEENRDNLSDVLAALQDDPDFGKPKPPPAPGAPAPGAAAQGGTTRRAIDAAMKVPGVDDAAPQTLEVSDALVADGRYAARKVRTSETVRAVKVRRPKPD